jgi:hypothetical protein
MNETTQQPGSGGVRRGVGLGIAMNLIYFGFWIGFYYFGLDRYWLTTGTGEFGVFFWSLFFIGATQALYIGPAVLYYRWKQRPGVVKGLIIAAAVTVLLNGACWAVMKS